MNAAKFPLDLTELQVFRDLAETFNDKPKAMMFIWFLWRDLGQLAQAGGAPGRMQPKEIGSFASLLAEVMSMETKEKALEFLHGRAVEINLLRKDGEDLVCPRFTDLNADMASREGRESRGGRMKAFRNKQRKMEENIIQRGLKLNGNIFVEADGAPLNPTDTQSVQRLIMSCDNALMVDRPPIGWSEGLVTLALQVVRLTTVDEMDYTLRTIVARRDHPLLAGLTTEKLLPQFKTIATKVS